MIQSILVALVVLGIIIVIHEFGHFAVAKLFKIKVETFSVGFGPRLIGFRHGETDYRISALPLGGYVKMSGENPGETLTGDPHEFMSKPKWQRFLVASAGPIMNIALAFVLLTGLLMNGMEIAEVLNNPAVVGYVQPDSPAAKAGIQSEDRIVSLDGKVDPKWQDLSLIVGTNADRVLSLVLDRKGQRIDTTIKPIRDERDGSGEVGMGPIMHTFVKEVNPGLPAEAAGLKPGDELIMVEGNDLRSSGKQLSETIQTVPADKKVHLTVLRDGKPVDFEIPTVEEQGRRMIGVRQQIPMTKIKLGFGAALVESGRMNGENAVLIFQVLGRLVRRQASLKQLDGPIGIVRASGEAASISLAAVITLMAAISLNLGLVNLLPIPVLDGGVMLLLIIEFVMGRDLSLRIKERIVQVSVAFLLLMMVVVLYNDVLKLLPRSVTAP